MRVAAMGAGDGVRIARTCLAESSHAVRTVDANRAAALAGGSLSLAFRPDTDDVQRSPATNSIRPLQEDGAAVTRMPDSSHARAEVVGVARVTTFRNVSGVRSAAVVTAAWPESVRLDWRREHGAMVKPSVKSDGRDWWGADAVCVVGFTCMTGGGWGPKRWLYWWHSAGTTLWAVGSLVLRWSDRNTACQGVLHVCPFVVFAQWCEALARTRNAFPTVRNGSCDCFSYRPRLRYAPL